VPVLRSHRVQPPANMNQPNQSETLQPRRRVTNGQAVAGTARTYVGANELKNFSAAARHALRKMQQDVDRTEVLNQLGELLIEHSRCRVVFEAKIPVKLSEISNESDSEASLQTAANSFAEIPANLPQWAFSAATRAATTGETVLEDAADAQSGPVSLVATLLAAENENSRSLSGRLPKKPFPSSKSPSWKWQAATSVVNFRPPNNSPPTLPAFRPSQPKQATPIR